MIERNCHLRHRPLGHFGGTSSPRRKLPRLHHRLEPQPRASQPRPPDRRHRLPSHQIPSKQQRLPKSSSSAVPIYATLDFMEQLRPSPRPSPTSSPTSAAPSASSPRPAIASLTNPTAQPFYPAIPWPAKNAAAHPSPTPTYFVAPSGSSRLSMPRLTSKKYEARLQSCR